ncbi:MAG: calcium/sodium antiporter [Rhodospirillales bacterium]
MLLTIMTVGGLIGLLVGGDLIVRGAVATALRLGLSPLLVGLTIVALGTSAPEAVTSVEAALAGAPALAVGNIIGSNIANVLLAIGLCALVRPMLIANASFRRDAWAVVGATLIGTALLFIGFVDRAMGILLLTGLVGYLVFAYCNERYGKKSALAQSLAEEGAAGADKPTPSLWRSLAITFLGLAAILIGAHFLVEGAVGVARILGLSEATIGATIVAIGTSLPEIVTSVAAALRGQSGVAIGNVIGSNLFNILGVLGATAIAVPFSVPAEVLSIDIWIMMGATVILWFIALQRPLVTRIEGGILFLCYCGYLALLLA